MHVTQQKNQTQNAKMQTWKSWLHWKIKKVHKSLSWIKKLKICAIAHCCVMFIQVHQYLIFELENNKKICYVISIQVLQHLKHKIYINYTHIYDLWMNPNLKILKVEGESSLKFKVWTYRLTSMVTTWINELKIIKALDFKHLLQHFFSTTNTQLHKLNKEHWKHNNYNILAKSKARGAQKKHVINVHF